MSRITHKGDTLILEYDLFSLPTAQHKAGLAGLLLHLDSLRQRRVSPIPRATVTGAQAEIEITQDSLQALFDDLYDAEWQEVGRKKKLEEREDRKFKRIEIKKFEINGKKKTEKRFVYDEITSKGRFIKDLFEDDRGLWVKLWRDMLWSTLRGIPQTRGVYKERALQQPSSLGEYFWKILTKAGSFQAKGKILSEAISSSIFLGAEDKSSERVPFRGAIAENLLLHFWPISSLIFVPRIYKLEKNRERNLKLTWQEKGYVLAIPVPFNLNDFCQDFKEVAKSLDPAISGFRPRAALIDLAEEGGIEYLHHFVRQKIKDTEMSLSLAAVEIYHLEKTGNRICQLGAERLIPREDILKDYGKFRDRNANFLYKSLYLRNLLYGNSWHQDAENIFSCWPWPFFIYYRDKTPKEIRFFGRDVRKKLNDIASDLQLKKEEGLMSDRDQDNQLALRINRIIKEYVNRRTEEKSKIKFKDFSQSKDDKGRIRYPEEYRKNRKRVCTDAFLDMHGRRDQAFIEYFTGTICSVPQFLPEADFLMISQALATDWSKIKALSMLALSAHSYLMDAIEEEKEDKES